MANTVVKSAAATTAELSDNTLNPDFSSASGGQRTIVHITLVCENTAVTPEAIYTALDTQFPVVAGEKNTFSRGTWIFNIGPA